MVLESRLGIIKLEFTLSCTWLKQLRKRYKARLHISHLFLLPFAVKFFFPKTGIGGRSSPQPEVLCRWAVGQKTLLRHQT